MLWWWGYKQCTGDYIDNSSLHHDVVSVEGGLKDPTSKRLLAAEKRDALSESASRVRDKINPDEEESIAHLSNVTDIKDRDIKKLLKVNPNNYNNTCVHYSVPCTLPDWDALWKLQSGTKVDLAVNVINKNYPILRKFQGYCVTKWFIQTYWNGCKDYMQRKAQGKVQSKVKDWPTFSDNKDKPLQPLTCLCRCAVNPACTLSCAPIPICTPTQGPTPDHAPPDNEVTGNGGSNDNLLPLNTSSTSTHCQSGAPTKPRTGRKQTQKVFIEKEVTITDDNKLNEEASHHGLTLQKKACV
ncbi:hypothetical protein BDV98DRAFT_586682 [Pterulicium gracile]|uniref:Uncharacterized protein n=1 Tax=Pterulicium gracile TaxID=1884261 RepID=A0A5C3Q206_9AGAR|nr:hypothetical protein BDV98DRAFT_586682 [Pterula gracilis]